MLQAIIGHDNIDLGVGLQQRLAGQTTFGMHAQRHASLFGEQSGFIAHDASLQDAPATVRLWPKTDAITAANNAWVPP